MYQSRLFKGIIGCLLLGVLISCGEERESPELKESYLEELSEPEQDTVKRAEEEKIEDIEDLLSSMEVSSDLSQFSRVLEKSTSLPDIGDNFFTIFAPTNEAVSLLLEEQSEMTADEVNKFIASHAVMARITQEELKSRAENSGGTLSLETLAGHEIEISLKDGEFMIGSKSGEKARIIESLIATNGVIHIIDHSLWTAETSDQL